MAQRPKEIDQFGRVKCSGCKEWKYPEEYFSNKRTKLGISTYCKPCHVSRQPKKERDGRKRYTLEEAAAILGIRNFDPAVLGPPKEEGGVVPPQPGAERKWIAGIGWCWVAPIPPEDLERPRVERKAIPDVAEHPNEPIPYADAVRLKDLEKEAKKLSTEELMRRAGHLDWDAPEAQWPLWQRVVQAELQKRQGVAE